MRGAATLAALAALASLSFARPAGAQLYRTAAPPPAPTVEVTAPAPTVEVTAPEPAPAPRTGPLSGSVTRGGRLLAGFMFLENANVGPRVGVAFNLATQLFGVDCAVGGEIAAATTEIQTRGSYYDSFQRTTVTYSSSDRLVMLMAYLDWRLGLVDRIELGPRFGVGPWLNDGKLVFSWSIGARVAVRPAPSWPVRFFVDAERVAIDGLGLGMFQVGLSYRF